MRPPHRFPFELVDRADDGTGSAAVTGGSWWLRGELPLTLPWIVEAAAQAAPRLQDRGAAEGGELALAAIDRAELDRPVAPGERLDLTVRPVGRWGSLVRIEADVRAEGRPIGRVALTLSAAQRPVSRPSRS